MKIGLLIPSTSNGRDWKNYTETYFYRTLKTFLLTCDNEHNYTFYIGLDRYDKVLDTLDFISNINTILGNFKNVSADYLYMDGITKGHLTIMWNRLFDKALRDGCDYFFQCGDDIEFKTKGWVNECIKTLQENNNIGLTGPINNNTRILTQSFVSRKHFDLFGCYFPGQIINWFCDDWINEVYRGLNSFFPLHNHVCLNVGGKPRYTVNNDPNWNSSVDKMRTICTDLVNKDLIRIKKIKKV